MIIIHDYYHVILRQFKIIVGAWKYPTPQGGGEPGGRALPL